jgi:signal transduction histidine kinase
MNLRRKISSARTAGAVRRADASRGSEDHRQKKPRRHAERLALAGITTATIALGTLSLWAAITTQNAAKRLSETGVQTSGHLRAIQAVTKIDTLSDSLEDGVEPETVAALRNAQRVLRQSLERMKLGEVRASAQIARDAGPIVHRMDRALEHMMAEVSTGDPERAEAAEDASNDVLEQLQNELGNLESDPSYLLTKRLAEASALERLVRNAAIVLVPFGLLFVLLCAWLISRSGTALVRSEERLQFAQKVARTGTWDVNVRSGEGTWSNAVREVLSAPADLPPSYENWLELVHEDDRDRIHEINMAAMERGGDYEYEYRRELPDGTTKWLLTRARAIHDDGGRPLRIIGATMDITALHDADEERTQLELRLRQAQKLEAVGRLAGGVAHDFNNLLLGIRGYGELALASVERGGRPTEEIGEIVTAADRAAALTRQLLAFSRQQVLQPETLDLNQILQDTDKLLRRLIGEDIEVVTLGAPDPVSVTADRGQLEQVLVNLAVNARDAMPSGGRLTIEVAPVELDEEHGLGMPPGRYARLAVSDTGHGMDAETAAQAFEPFFTTKEDGTGLGLATVHGIVKQSGGTVWVYSEPGSGTTFKIYLPLCADAAASSAPAPVGRLKDGNGETIMLVEDEERVRGAIEGMLAARRYRVVAAANGAEALAFGAAPGESYDLLLTDLLMPGIDGREVATRFRELHPDVPVLYMSGYTDDDVMRRGVTEAGSAFLQKPFSSEELAQRIDDLLTLPRSPHAVDEEGDDGSR